MNNLLVLVLFGSMIFGEFQRLPGLPLYLHDLVLIGFLLVNLRRLKLFRPILWFALAAFVSLVMAAFKLPFNKILTAALYLLRFLAYSLLIDLKIDRRWLLIFFLRRGPPWFGPVLFRARYPVFGRFKLGRPLLPFTFDSARPQLYRHHSGFGPGFDLSFPPCFQTPVGAAFFGAAVNLLAQQLPGFGRCRFVLGLA